jgi:TRAP-type mannitol/chloroaromatic compound transport system permease small subunit
MERFIEIADAISAWFGKAFAWCILIMTFGVGYEVFVRYVLRDPTSWAFDLSYIMYGSLFMMGGAYALSRDSHVRGDFIYRLWRPQTQAKVEVVR